MTDTPIVRLDPERLRNERHEVDLGDDESGFDQVATNRRDSEVEPVSLGEQTAGANPPAR